MHTRLWAQISRRQTFLLKLALGIGLIGVVLHFVDVNEMVAVVRRLDPRFILLIIALIYTDRALMVYKWNPLLRTVGIRVPFGVLFRLYVVAPFAGMLLPAGVGSDLFRAYGVARYGFNVKAVLASILVERALGFMAMLLLVLTSVGLAVALFRQALADFAILWWLLGSGVLLGTGMVAAYCLVRGPGGNASRRMSRLLLVRQLQQIYGIAQRYKGHRGTLGVALAWTCLEQLVPIGMNYLVARSLHVEVSILEVAAIVPIIVLAIRLPISLGGIGVQEGLSVALYALVGVSPAEALLMNALGRLLHVGTQLPWAVYYLVSRHRSLPTQQDITAVTVENSSLGC
jgi:uncharacterized protein (TIRG00374 family)